MTITHGGNIYALARQLGCAPEEILDFSASINPLGMAPGVKEALIAAVSRVPHYPEPQSLTLRNALGGQWQLPPEYILTGNGATELIHFVARTPRPVTLLIPTFSEFHRAYPEAKLVKRWPDLDGLAVVTRPNNPQGDLLPLAAIEGILQAGHALIVDESFIEFTEAESALSLIPKYADLLVLRSLTKLHALPGLRIGALAGQAIPAMLPRREPWQVSVLAEAAALVAIEATGHHRATREFVTTERAWLTRQLTLPGLSPQPSVANYLLVKTAQNPADLAKWLAARRVLVRDCTHIPGVDEPAIRVAVRTRPDNLRLIDLLQEYLCAAQ
ncbi:MAG: aminotransferase class I/II-fold pyridoxal phosphate-dependent enzyme [Bryobacteraceae bacterium]|nr:aminotransferase class I/II-fold pyridoxal phosphate-dependent enzyme [Bryobacteraceae bacterium]